MRLPLVIPRWFDWLWLGLLAMYIVAGAAIVPFHGDESTLMVMGRDYHYIFVEGDLSKVFFDLDLAKQSSRAAAASAEWYCLQDHIWVARGEKRLPPAGLES